MTTLGIAGSRATSASASGCSGLGFADVAADSIRDMVVMTAALSMRII
jgi:hypothetical protein